MVPHVLTAAADHYNRRSPNRGRPRHGGSAITDGPPRRRTSLVHVVVLTGFWVGLWGVITPATVVSGVVLSALLDRTSPNRVTGPVRPGAALRAAWRLLLDTLASNAAMARAVIVGSGRVDERVDDVPLAHATSHEEPLVSLAVTLTPGTIVVASEPTGAGAVRVHSLGADSARVAELVHRTERVIAALDGDLERGRP